MTGCFGRAGGAMMMSVMLLAASGVPNPGLAAQATSSSSQPAAARSKVDINRASAVELERLPGMSPKLAQRIIANRPYRKIDDLVRRKVLGRKQLAAIKEYIAVGPSEDKRESTPSR